MLSYPKTPAPLPDALRGEQYAFVGMPVAEFRRGNINGDNIGVGRLGGLGQIIHYPLAFLSRIENAFFIETLC